MPTDQDAEALRLRLETLIKEADNTEAKAVVARCRVQAARQLLEEEQAVAADLDRKSAAAKRLLPPSSSSLTTADTPNGTSYDSTVVSNLHIQATTVSNVRQLVNIVLDTTSSNYALWRDLMLMALI
jgi:hypothetical protein